MRYLGTVPPYHTADGNMPQMAKCTANPNEQMISGILYYEIFKQFWRFELAMIFLGITRADVVMTQTIRFTFIQQ